MRVYEQTGKMYIIQYIVNSEMLNNGNILPVFVPLGIPLLEKLGILICVVNQVVHL